MTDAGREIDVEALRKLEAEATSGPWFAEAEGRTGYIQMRGVEIENGHRFGIFNHAADVDFVVATRNALPALLAAYEERDRWKEAAIEAEAAMRRAVDTIPRMTAEVDRLRGKVEERQAWREQTRTDNGRIEELIRERDRLRGALADALDPTWGEEPTE